MAISLKPLGDRVVLEAVEQEATTASGLVLPDTAKEKSQQGKVLAVGPDIEGEISVDDVVLYAKYAGTEVKIEGNAVLILSEADILALVK
ncbi:MAG: co-chaperone GroES [Anaerolineae bacterium]|jgi:chaperonin GroES|nr:co-chaperone GroES [Anaerolineae bacterium]MBL6966683.1 co-chaperone GroES [Anaerolineales bacterium]MBT3390024.1 co-chaperone GroES [Chloroflexota bacterium]